MCDTLATKGDNTTKGHLLIAGRGDNPSCQVVKAWTIYPPIETNNTMSLVYECTVPGHFYAKLGCCAAQSSEI